MWFGLFELTNEYTESSFVERFSDCVTLDVIPEFYGPKVYHGLMLGPRWKEVQIRVAEKVGLYSSVGESQKHWHSLNSDKLLLERTISL